MTDRIKQALSEGRKVTLFGEPLANDAGDSCMWMGNCIVYRNIENLLRKCPDALVIEEDSVMLECCGESAFYPGSTFFDGYIKGTHTKESIVAKLRELVK